MSKLKFKRLLLSDYFLPFCFLLAVLLRVLWVLLIDSKAVSDSNWYFEKGIDISLGKGYTINGIETAYYPAGYPLFLGLIFKIFGNYLLTGKAANIILYIGILYFGYVITEKIFNSKVTAGITLLILSIYPNYIAYSSVLSTEILFLFLLFLGLYLYLLSDKSFWLPALSGIAWGLMCLVKPQGFFIPLIFILTLAVHNRKDFKHVLKTAVLIYVFIIITLAPWLIRNFSVYKEFPVISTNDGINLLIGNNPYANGEYLLDEKIVAYLWDKDNKYDSPEALVKNLSVSEFWTSYGYENEIIASKKFRSRTIDFIIHNPGHEIKLLPKKLWLNYKKGNDGVGWAIAEVPIESPAKKTAVQIFSKAANYFYYFIVLFSVIFIVTSLYRKFILKRSIRFHSAGLWMIVYFTLLAIAFFGSYRFNFPVLPWLIMYSSAFFGELIDPARS